MKKRITVAFTFLGGLWTFLTMIYYPLDGKIYSVDYFFLFYGMN